MDPRSLECPNCGRDDRVTKATLIAQNSVFGNGATYTSQLAAQFQKPNESHMGLGCSSLGLFLVGIFVTLGAIYFLFDVILSTPNRPVPVAIALGVLSFLLIRAGIQKRANFERAMLRWNELYFCDRCDGVFILAKGKLIPRTDRWKYIFGRE